MSSPTRVNPRDVALYIAVVAIFAVAFYLIDQRMHWWTMTVILAAAGLAFYGIGTLAGRVWNARKGRR